jgi:hypothetical protein
MYNTSYNRTII